MDLLVVVVVVLGIMVGANLLLTGAVVRRLAAHERKFAALGPMLGVPGGLAAGADLPPFTAETVDGRSVDAGFLGDGPGVIAFFSTTCAACLSHAPEFAAVASGTSGLAVVSGEDGDELLSALGSTPVVRERESGGPIVTAFEVDTFPTYYVVEGGRVVVPVDSAAAARNLLASGVPSA
ncbi:hypothetical protein [Pseudonocardia sp. MH-G8]|uniref:TlpA family protein disulfide reductase n=1 Tax=Pseudonocardia sp. MH-G8 TaxID=1854588 RepID=UPI000B9FF530|nr:hypothetical protein [Pseudonocardia sp. MH-G8]OZM83238.1 hypothetical protein CFP66_01400 [Pseudonocardia sp. MH-G8]